MMGWSPQCYIPISVEIGLPVPEKKIFEGFLPIYGHGGHLGHLTSIMSPDFHFLVPESFLRKSSLNFCMYTTLGQGQEMTLTFNTQLSSNKICAPTTFQVTGWNSF